MLAALFDHGIRPDLLVGTSAGALNGAAVAFDPTPAGVERLAAVWCALDGTMVFTGGTLALLRALVRRGLAVGHNDGLRRLLEQVAPGRTFEEALVPLHVVATSLTTGSERWFSSGSLVEPLLASAALPAVYPPVAIDGELYVDGGVIDNVPIGRAVELGAARVFVCHVGNFERTRPTPRRPIDVLLQSWSVARNYRYLADVRRPWPGVEVIVLPSIDPGPLRRNDFSHAAALIARARATASRALALPRAA